MNTTVEQNTEKIDSICEELLSAAEAISKLNPVTHLSQSYIQWHGGILGAIQESREDKRLVKLMNAPLYKEWSFYRFAFHIIDVCEELVALQLEVQKQVSSDNPLYFDNTKKIAFCIDAVSKSWYNYSPDMANEGLTIEDQKNVALAPSVYGLTKDEIAKMDLPPELQSYKEAYVPPKKGCFSVILMLIIGTASLIGLSFWGINSFII